LFQKKIDVYMKGRRIWWVSLQQLYLYVFSKQYHDAGSRGSRLNVSISSTSKSDKASFLIWACFVNISSNFSWTNLEIIGTQQW